MTGEFDLDKELAPIAGDLISGKKENVVLGIAAVLTKFLTGSSFAAAAVESGLAKLIAKSSYAKLERDCKELEAELQQEVMIEHLKQKILDAIQGDFRERKHFIEELTVEESASVKRFVDSRAQVTEQIMQQGNKAVLDKLYELGRDVLESKPRAAEDLEKITHLPFGSIGDFFIGRDKELSELRRQLERSDVSAISQVPAIHGLGGIGKTRLAVEYAWRYRDTYQHVFFIRADSASALHANLAQLGNSGILNLPGFVDLRSEQIQMDAVVRWLGSHKEWLLILDNIDTEEAAIAVKQLLPLLSCGHVMLTSRIAEWSGDIKAQSLDVMSKDQSVAFLLARTESKRIKQQSDASNAAILADKLGHLPLGLETAAAYVLRKGISIAGYVELWESKKRELMSWCHETLTQYPDSLMVTWKRTFDELVPVSKAVLNVCSFLAPDPLPAAMIEKSEERIGEIARKYFTDFKLMSIGDAIDELVAYSMLSRSDGLVSVHRLVQEFLRFQILQEDQANWVVTALQMVNTFLPSDRPSYDFRSWPIWDTLKPHMKAILDRADQNHLTDPTSRLLNDLGLYLKAKAQYAEAEPLMKRALEIDEKSFGKDHPNVARDLNNLAQLLKETNRLSEAEPLMRRALEICLASYGENHPNSQTARRNLDALQREISLGCEVNDPQ